MASFLSALNDRDRRLRRLAGAPRAAAARGLSRRCAPRVGPGFVVGCRFLGDECIEGGSGVDDAAWFGAELARAGMDYLSLSQRRQVRGRQAAQGRLGRAIPTPAPAATSACRRCARDARGPFGRNRRRGGAPCARRCARPDCATPVVLSGGIATFEQAEEHPARGRGRHRRRRPAELADPDWFRKLRLGRGDEVRRCVFTNYCEGLDQAHKQVTCKLWDHLDGERRMVAPAWEPAAR